VQLIKQETIRGEKTANVAIRKRPKQFDTNVRVCQTQAIQPQYQTQKTSFFGDCFLYHKKKRIKGFLKQEHCEKYLAFLKFFS
jgi:hypothetical protein